MTEELIERLLYAQVSSCNCSTKTYEHQYHSETCFYRVLGDSVETIEQLHRELEDVQHVSQLHYDANLSLRQQLAAQDLVIEKLREVIKIAGELAQALDSCGDVADNPRSVWVQGEAIKDWCSQALSSTPDYTKLLAERDAKYILEIEKLREKLEQAMEWNWLDSDIEEYVDVASFNEAVASTDYRKELAEHDAALLERVADRIVGELEGLAGESAMLQVHRTVEELAAKIRAGEEG